MKIKTSTIASTIAFTVADKVLPTVACKVLLRMAVGLVQAAVD